MYVLFSAKPNDSAHALDGQDARDVLREGVRMLRFLSWAKVAFVLWTLGCSSSQNPEPVPSSEESYDTVVHINRGKNGVPETITLKSGQSQQEQQDALRSAMGMLTKAQEDQIHRTMEASEVAKLKPISCLHIGRYSSSAFYDAERLGWTGTNYHAAVVPVLEVKDDVVKTVVQTANPNQYDIVYFTKERLVERPEETQYYMDKGNYNEVKSLVPGLCESSMVPAPPSKL